MRFLPEVFALPTATIIAISVLCAIGVNSALSRFASLLVRITIFPITVLASMCAMQAGQALQLMPGKGLDAWLLATVLSSGVGMAFGLLLVAVATHLYGLVAARRRRRLAPETIERHVWAGPGARGPT